MIEDARGHSSRWRVLSQGFTAEGRYVEVDLADRPVTVASLYLPKGGLPAHLQKPGSMRGPRRRRPLRPEDAFLTGFARRVDASRRRALAAGRDYLLMGDFNIAHAPLDVVNWKRQHRSGASSPRARLARHPHPAAPAHDVVRRLHPDTRGPYSWWWQKRRVLHQGHRVADRPPPGHSAPGATALTGGTDRDAAGDARVVTTPR